MCVSYKLWIQLGRTLNPFNALYPVVPPDTNATQAWAQAGLRGPGQPYGSGCPHPVTPSLPQVYPGDGRGRGEFPPGLLDLAQILIFVEQVLGQEEVGLAVGCGFSLALHTPFSGPIAGTCPCSGSSLPSCSDEKLSSSSSE